LYLKKWKETDELPLRGFNGKSLAALNPMKKVRSDKMVGSQRHQRRLESRVCDFTSHPISEKEKETLARTGSKNW